eukprot:SAG31_NODE_126_length_23665_cov_6.178987_23_plen_52_part_00
MLVASAGLRRGCARASSSPVAAAVVLTSSITVAATSQVGGVVRCQLRTLWG